MDVNRVNLTMAAIAEQMQTVDNQLNAIRTAKKRGRRNAVEFDENEFQKYLSNLQRITNEMERGETDKMRKLARRLKKESPLQKWRRATRVVRLLCAVSIAIQKYAVEAGIMENYLVNLKSQQTNPKDANKKKTEILFSLEDFKVKFEMRVPKYLIAILQKAPHMRTADDINAVCRLMKNIGIFRKYTHEMQLMMSTIVRYQKCKQKRVVLRKGHIGYCLYFIYSGSVLIVLDSEEEDQNVEREDTFLRKGACFGEIALLRDTRRNATVVCAEDCEFLVVDKDDFTENGLNLQTQGEFNERLDFFRSWPPLQGLPDSIICEMTNISRTEDFNYNKVIVKDSCHNDWLLFIIKGSCDILRLVDMHTSPKINCIASANSNQRTPVSTTILQARTALSKRRVTEVSRPQSSPVVKQRSEATVGFTRGDPLSGRSSAPTLRRQRSLNDDSLYKNDSMHRVKNDSMHRVKNDSMHRVKNDSMHRVKNDSMHRVKNDSMYRLKNDSLYRVKNSTGMKTFSRENVRQPSQTGNDESSVYMRVDTLRDGQAFGLEGMLKEYNPSDYPVYTMVSKGCTVIHLPRAKMKELIDDVVVAMIGPYIKTYPSELELREHFLWKCDWDNHKHRIVRDVLKNRQTRLSYSNSFRNCLHPDKLATFERDYMTPQYYISEASPAVDSVRMKSRHPSAPVTGRPRTTVSQSAVLMPKRVRFNHATDRKPISFRRPISSNSNDIHPAIKTTGNSSGVFPVDKHIMRTDKITGGRREQSPVSSMSSGRQPKHVSIDTSLNGTKTI